MGDRVALLLATLPSEPSFPAAQQGTCHVSKAESHGVPSGPKSKGIAQRSPAPIHSPQSGKCNEVSVVLICKIWGTSKQRDMGGPKRANKSHREDDNAVRFSMKINRRILFRGE